MWFIGYLVNVWRWFFNSVYSASLEVGAVKIASRVVWQITGTVGLIIYGIGWFPMGQTFTYFVVFGPVLLWVSFCLVTSFIIGATDRY